MARSSIHKIFRFNFNPFLILQTTPLTLTRFISSSYSSNSLSISLQTCQNMKQLLQIQANLTTTGQFKHPFPATQVLKFAADSGDIDYAVSIFRQIDKPDNFCINTVIKAYSQSGDPCKSIVFYFEMVQQGFIPNSFTFPPLLNSCVKIPSLDDGEKFHGQVVKYGVENVVQVCNSLVHLYAVCRIIGCARQLFDEMPERDLVSWNSMLDGYAKLGDLLSARQLFGEMPERNVVSWNVMICGYLRGRNPGCVLKMFREMGKMGLRGSVTTIVCIVTACGRSNRLKEGRSVHGFFVRNFTGRNLIAETALVDMYSKCRRVEVARRVFDGISVRNLVCWNAMVLGHCIHGCPRDGLALFAVMVGKGCEGEESGLRSQTNKAQCVLPDEVTFIGVLCGCARAGLLLEGKKFFEQMTNIYRITPKFAHYWCVANLYGKLGFLQEAEEVLRRMPDGYESSIWSGLFGSCRFRGDIELGERIAKHLIELEPYNESRYTLLWNVYAVAGQWGDVAKVKEMMNERGIKIMPGCSLINLNEIVHEFKVGDRSKPEMEKIYMMMDELADRLKTMTDSQDPMEFG